MSAIQTFNLCKTFRQKREKIVALDNVNLNMEGNEIYGLLGPNGAGKTTLIHVLSTLITPTSGNASVAGFDLLKEQQKIKERIGICFGGAEFYWDFSPNEILNYYAMTFDIPREKRAGKIKELSKDLKFGKFIDKKFYTLSTGMKQKIAIAKALLNDPEVVFMDEPTNGLDVEIAIEVRKYLRNLVRKTQTTILLTSHNMHEIEIMCKNVSLINRGRIVREGRIDSIKKGLNFPDTIFISPEGSADCGFMWRLKGVDRMQKKEGGIFVETRDTQRTLERIFAEFRRRKIKIGDMEIRKASLEEAFLKIIGEAND